MYNAKGIMKFAIEPKIRAVQFIIMSSQPLVWNGMMMIQGTKITQKAAHFEEHIRPRSKFLRITMQNTGTEVARTATGKRKFKAVIKRTVCLSVLRADKVARL